MTVRNLNWSSNKSENCQPFQHSSVNRNIAFSISILAKTFTVNILGRNDAWVHCLGVFVLTGKNGKGTGRKRGSLQAFHVFHICSSFLCFWVALLDATCLRHCFLWWTCYIMLSTLSNLLVQTKWCTSCRGFPSRCSKHGAWLWCRGLVRSPACYLRCHSHHSPLRAQESDSDGVERHILEALKAGMAPHVEPFSGRWVWESDRASLGPLP